MHPGRLLAIGDIHGHPAALDAVLEMARPGAADLLVLLGDYVDRGPDSRGVLERVRRLASQPWVRALRGNHEQLMRGARFSKAQWDLWLFNGGRETLRSYGMEPDRRRLSGYVPKAHWDFLDYVCRDWFETPDTIFVHAGLVPHLPPAEQGANALHWLRFDQLRQHHSGRQIVCGHTPQGPWPGFSPAGICVDTGMADGPGKGVLTCFDLTNGVLYRADGQQERSMVRVPRTPLSEGSTPQPTPLRRGSLLPSA